MLQKCPVFVEKQRVLAFLMMDEIHTLCLGVERRKDKRNYIGYTHNIYKKVSLLA
jgi:hypothetical protein